MATNEREDHSLITSHHSPGSKRDILGALLAGLLVVAFSLILLRHDPLLFWNDDYELSILPVFADVARSWSHGEWPLLSPYSWVCGNLAGEYQYGTFSVFVNAAVVLIWKFPLTFPQQAAALSIAHLFVLAMGGYLLARGRNLPSPFVYLVVTGGFPYTVLMLGLVATWLGFKSLGQTRRLSSIGPLAVGIALGLGLAAPAWLALL